MGRLNRPAGEQGLPIERNCESEIVDIDKYSIEVFHAVDNKGWKLLSTSNTPDEDGYYQCYGMFKGQWCITNSLASAITIGKRAGMLEIEHTRIGIVGWGGDGRRIYHEDHIMLSTSYTLNGEMLFQDSKMEYHPYPYID